MRRGGWMAFWRHFRRAAAFVLAAVLIAGTLEPLMSLADSGAYAGADAAAVQDGIENDVSADAEEASEDEAEADGGEALLAGDAAVPVLAQAAMRVQGSLADSSDAKAGASNGASYDAQAADVSAGRGQEGTAQDAAAGSLSDAAGNGSAGGTASSGLLAGDAGSSSAGQGSSSDYAKGESGDSLGFDATSGQGSSSDSAKGEGDASSSSDASAVQGPTSDAASSESGASSGSDAASGQESSSDAAKGGSGASSGTASAADSAFSGEEYVPDFVEEVEPTEELTRPLMARTFKVAANASETSNEAYEIRYFASQFISGASKNDDGDCVWTPSGKTGSGHEFVYRVNYEISGDFEIPAGGVKITIPKSILNDRGGNAADKYEMSLPSVDEYIGTTEFAYYEDGDNLVITNMEEIPAGTEGYFEVAYATSKSTFEYTDYGAEGDKSDDFNAVITVEVPDYDTISDTSASDGVYIDTTAKITSTQKQYPTICSSWDSAWGEAPDDADEYYYLVWGIVSDINATQPYDFTVTDELVSDLTEGFNGAESGDYEIIKLKMSGGSYQDYPSDDPDAFTQYGLRGSKRTDYVVTRHKKSAYDKFDYKLKNTVKTKVHPADGVDSDSYASGSNTFVWQPEIIPPVGHFYLEKYGRSYVRYDLQKFRPEYDGDDKLDEYSGFTYTVYTRGYPYPWTLEEGASSDEMDKYGVNPVTYDTKDTKLYLEGDSEPLSPEDYYIKSLSFTVSNSDAEAVTSVQTGKTKFETKAAEYSEAEEIEFYIQVDGEDAWIKAAVYNLYSKSFTFSNGDYVKSTSDSGCSIVFADGAGVTGWRQVTTNAHYYTEITTRPHVVLRSTDYVMEKVTKKSVISLKNVADAEVTYAGEVKNGETIFKMSAAGTDQARETYFESRIKKEATYGSNDVLNQRYTIGWAVEMNETMKGGANSGTEYVKQDGGIFYDLLPAGGTFDAASLAVSGGGPYLKEGEYDIETIDNYNDTGRTLLIIRISTPANYYKISYTTIHNWDSIGDYGRLAKNRVVYETGNESITGGVNAEGLEKKDADFAGFGRDGKAYLYTDASTNINALTAAVSGLYKKVKAEGGSDYSYSTETAPGGAYSYKLRFQNTYVNSSKKLVFFDSLENYDMYEEEPTSGWKGTLTAVDVSQLISMGIAPKVYISTQENLDPEAYYGANYDAVTGTVAMDPSVWTEVPSESLSDADLLSGAKAVAIDMTYRSDGSEFVLESGKSVTAVLYMKAPTKIASLENPYAYNNIYIADTVADALGGGTDFFIHQDYTKLKFHVVADVAAYKVSSEDDERYISGTVFRLTGASDYGTEVDEYATSNSKGRIIFKEVESGTYTLTEYSCSDDWQLSDKARTVAIDAEGKVYIDGTEVTEDGFIASDSDEDYKIENEPRHHTDIYFYKRDLSDYTKVVAGVKFRLSGRSDYGNEILMYAASDANGRVAFENVEEGIYELAEVETAKGYVLSNAAYKVVVDSNDNFAISGDGCDYSESGAYSIYNEPYHGFYFQKKDAYNFEPLGGAQFHLYGASADGEPYDKTVTSVEGTGYVTFEGLQAGSYILEETKTPDHDGITYVAGGAKHIVNVDVYGTVTMDGTVIWPYAGEESGEESEENDAAGEGVVTEGTEEAETDTDAATAVNGTAAGKGQADGTAAGSGSGSEGTAAGNGAEADSAANKTDAANSVGTAVENASARAEGGSDGSAAGSGSAANAYAGSDATANAATGTVDGASADADVSNEIAEGSVSEANAAAGTAVYGAGTAASEADGTAQADAEEAEEGANALAASNAAEDDSVYVWYNTRNRGQLTVTKRWNDELTNEQRVEPVVYVSTQKPEQGKTKAYFRTVATYKSIIYYAANGKTVTSFKRNTSLSEAEVKALGAVRIDNQYDKDDVKYKIYGWVDDDGTFYWWSNAEVGVLPSNLSYYFYSEGGLTTIDWSGIAKTSFWTGIAGAEMLTESVSEMQDMFYGCSGINNLDISWVNNSGITSASYMQYAFGNYSSSSNSGQMVLLKYIKIGENYQQYDTSVWKPGTWRNNDTGIEYLNTELTGTLIPGTYEYLGIKVKYAVQIYGIQQDKDASGATLGLSFGPATGASYRNSYVTHTYEDAGDGTYYVVIVTHTVSSDGSETTTTAYLTDSSGSKVTRTAEEKAKYDVNIHEMSWSEIAAQSQADPTVFRDCMLCGDTKSVGISLNSKLASGSAYSAYGDGFVLRDTVNSTYRKWNNSYNDREGNGYAGSRIRATLVGKDEYTNTGANYAGGDALTDSESLYSCLDSELQGVIAAKRVTTVTGTDSSQSTISTSDKLWLFSPAEMCGNYWSWDSLEGLSDSYPMAYQKFSDTESAYFVSTTSYNETNSHRVVCTESGSSAWWWLRAPGLIGGNSARGVHKGGGVYNYPYVRNPSPLGFGFCLR